MSNLMTQLVQPSELLLRRNRKMGGRKIFMEISRLSRSTTNLMMMSSIMISSPRR